MSTNKEINAQIASDDVGTIADTVDELHKLLDRFFESHDAVVTNKFEEIWPGHSDISRDLVSRLSRLADHLAPPT